MIAVFQRPDVSTLTSILVKPTEDHDFELLSFVLQPASGDGTVPDAEISSGFHFLFEIKTAYGVVNEVQLRGHLKHLPETRSLRELLIVVSPASKRPALFLRWMRTAHRSSGFRSACFTASSTR